MTLMDHDNNLTYSEISKWILIQLFYIRDPRDLLTRTEDPVGSFQCKLCSYNSKQQSNALRHVKFMHLGHSENVVCHLCNKVFTRKANFNEHLRTVHREYSSIMMEPTHILSSWK